MEGANEAARRAVNGIIAASGSDAQPCELWKLHEPSLLKMRRKHDKKRFEKDLPWDGKASGIGLLGFIANMLISLVRILKKSINIFRKK